jgi:hypothetical protein
MHPFFFLGRLLPGGYTGGRLFAVCHAAQVRLAPGDEVRIWDLTLAFIAFSYRHTETGRAFGQPRRNLSLLFERLNSHNR